MYRIKIRDLVGSEKEFNADELKEFYGNEIAAWEKLFNSSELKNKILYKPINGSYMSDKPPSVFGSYVNFKSNLTISDMEFDDIKMREDRYGIIKSFSNVIFSDSPAFQGLKEIVQNEKNGAAIEEASRLYVSGIKSAFKLYEVGPDEEHSAFKGYAEKGFSIALISTLEKGAEYSEASLLKARVDAVENLNIIKNTRTYAQEESNGLIKEYKKRAGELESLHGELLRLQKPASYWAESAKKYKKSGNFWSCILGISIIFIALVFYFFFIPMLDKTDGKISLVTAQTAVIIMLGSAVFFYFIRVCSRLVFSSFHLMRDAEEREQLTYVYLSLIKDGSIDSGARSIILQSLFSRTDTGLLGGDSSPTMPTADILKLLKSDKGSG
ncbi:hypothetical protein HX099_10620 [Thiopseudomonas alkaliphila]|uniref:DUF6161 domain-containing protein n=1 Tax=Thiopseudomonas alkaliphila TaxID=1697053 RepID=A0AAW7DWM9_9GAMM|nr:DUF6161 domain-containing protein [Thiopseudomonas alkaliphila]MDM1697106.1 hypothetical protein [Thiopseudomonas alkaliphila]